MAICETSEKIFAIVKEELLILLRTRLTAEIPLATVERILEMTMRTGVIAEKIIRIVGEIGVVIEEIFRATEDTEVITEEDFGVTVVTDAITEGITGVTEDIEVIIEEIFRATGDSGVITQGISEPIVKFDGITNDIIPHGQITGSDILPSVTAINIQVDHTEVEAGVKLIDVRFFTV